MDVGGEDKRDLEVDVEHDSMDDLIRDRFRLNAISIAEAEGQSLSLSLSPPFHSIAISFFWWTTNLT